MVLVPKREKCRIYFVVFWYQFQFTKWVWVTTARIHSYRNTPRLSAHGSPEQEFVTLVHTQVKRISSFFRLCFVWNWRKFLFFTTRTPALSLTSEHITSSLGIFRLKHFLWIIKPLSYCLKKYKPQTLVSYCFFLNIKVQNTHFRKVQTFKLRHPAVLEHPC